MATERVGFAAGYKFAKNRKLLTPQRAASGKVRNNEETSQECRRVIVRIGSDKPHILRFFLGIWINSLQFSYSSEQQVEVQRHSRHSNQMP
jgi:hypothetical protein